MKIVYQCVVPALLVAIAVHGLSPTATGGTIQTAFAPTGGNNTGGTPAQSTSRGFLFTPQSDLEVTSLGVFDTDGVFGSGNGLSFDMPVGIFRDDMPGSPLIRVEIPQGTSATLIDGFRCVDIPPLLLTAGQRYSIMSFYSSSGSEGTRAGAAHNPHALLGPVQAVAVQSNTFTDLVFTTAPTGGSFGPNFQFIAVPEPGTLALQVFGGAIAVVRRHRRGSARPSTDGNQSLHYHHGAGV